MVSRALVALLLGAPFVGAAVGCSLAAPGDTDSSSDRQTASGSTADVLKSVLQLGGCTAAKVGPRQLLVAARCATGFAAGQTITFTSAAEGKIAAAASDAAAFDASSNDGGGDASAAARSVTLAEVDIHPSFAEACADSACDFTNVAASDAADIAVLVLDADLDTVPTIPVDLDPVAPADSLLTVTSSCAAFESKPTRALHTAAATAVPATSVVYKGSPYAAAPGLAARLGTSYVVTAAAAWVMRSNLSDVVSIRGHGPSKAHSTANHPRHLRGCLFRNRARS